MDEDEGCYVEDSFSDWMVVYQCGGDAIDDDVAGRARKLAALRRLYCADYEDGTWL